MTKFSSGTAYKLGLLSVLALLILALASVVPVAGVSAVDITAAYAVDSDNGTSLADGYGAQFGVNTLRTTTDDFYASSGAIDFSNGRIAFGSGSATHTVSSKVKLSIGPSVNEAVEGNYYSNLSSNASVAYAINNPDIDVNATFNITLQSQSQFSGVYNGEIKIKFGNLEESAAISAASTSGSYTGNLQVTLSIPAGAASAAEASRFELSVTMRSPSDDNKFYISSANLTLSSHVKTLSIDQTGAGVGITVSGKNRTTVSIPNIYTGTGPQELAALYVKEGDVVTITASLLSENNEGIQTTHAFDYSFAAAMKRIGQSCLEWYTFVNGNYTSSTTYLKRISEQAAVYMPASSSNVNERNVYFGYTASFVVGSGVSNARTLNIVPRIPSGISSSGAYVYQNAPENSAEYITLNVDNSAPAAPTLAQTNAFASAIARNAWYTTSSQIRLTYENTTAVSGVGSNEFVYAFILDNGVDNSSLTGGFSGYDFTPSLNTYPTDCNITYSVGGVSNTAARQQLGVYDTATSNTGKNALVFDEPGEYCLVLYAVDAAGNVSERTVYYSAKVDWTTRSVGAYFTHAGATYVPNTSSFGTYASVYVLDSTLHDADGNCTAAPDVTSGSGVSDANRNLINVSRDTYVTVRVVMNDNQADNYSLVRYSIGNSISVQNPSYTVTERGYRVYDITFRMDDAIWDLNNDTQRPVTVYFNRRMAIELLENDFTFTTSWGEPVSVTLDNDSFKVYFPNDPGASIGVKPNINVQYYKQLTYYFYAYYEVIDGENKVTTGGYIEVEGMRYDFADDESLLPYIQGEVPFVTGDHVYQAYSNPSSSVYDSTLQIARYTVIGYDTGAARDTGFKDAGDYFFYAQIDTADSTDYYGELFSTFTVKKASPGVTGAYADNELTYGDSLDELNIYSKNTDGSIIDGSQNIFGRVFYQSAAGVWGEYSITSPVPGTADYVMHDVIRNYIITVTFTPIDVSEFTNDQITAYYDTFFYQFVDEVRDSLGALTGYTLKEGTLTAQNFASQIIEISVNINHALAYVEADNDSLSYEYDGHEKSVVPSAYVLEGNDRVYIDDVAIIAEYKALDADDSAYTLTAPTTAGIYTVRLTIDRDKCNYDGDVEIVTLTITQRILEVFVSDGVEEHTRLDQPDTLEGYTYSDILTYTYGYVSTADYYAGYEDSGAFVNVDSLLYVFSFRQIYAYDADGNTYNISANTQWGEEVSVIPSAQHHAGVYMMRVRVDNVNNGGSIYVLMRVLQAAVGSSNLDVRMPSVSTPYDAYIVNGDYMGQIGNMEFGETLAEASAAIIAANGNARYTYSGYSVATMISGRFLFESESAYELRNGTILPSNGNGEKVLDVLYDASGNFIPHSVRLLWQAGEYDNNGEFVPNTDFAGYYDVVNIYVVRATPDFGGVRLTDITYGDALSAAAFEGEVVSHGFVFGEGDYTLVIPQSDLGDVPEGGERTVYCEFTPSEALISRYLALDEIAIPLTVNKREVVIDFAERTDITADDCDGEDHNAVVTRVYGTQYVAPATRIMAGEQLITASLQYVYYREATAFDPAETVVVIDGASYVRIDMNPSVEAGKYYVYAEVLASNVNYEGYIFDTYFVVKATLAYSGGVLPSKSISYGESISSVDFGNVSLTAGSEIYYGSFELVVPDGEGGYLTEAYLPVSTDTEFNTIVRFIPSGSDEVIAKYNKNYHPYTADYFLQVNKKDISEAIEVSDLVHVYDGLLENKSISASVADPENEGEYLPLRIEYADEVRTQAGVYGVTVSLDESVTNFTGKVTVELVIEKAKVYFRNPTDYETVYNGMAQPFVPDCYGDVAIDYTALGIEAEYFYYTDGTQLTSVPSRIGKYSVKAVVNDSNFEGGYEGVFAITPSLNADEPFTGLDQVYNPATGSVAVAPNYNKIIIGGTSYAHPQVAHEVIYLIDGEETSAPPVNAGVYKVKIVFDENGYSKTYEQEMTVAKAQAIFEISAVYNRTYTSEPVSFSVPLPAGITEALYEFKTSGASEEEFVSETPVNAGVYDVRITLISTNYEGSATTVLNIAKADPEITALPYVYGTIAFGTESGDVTFNGGKVIFPATGDDVEGTFVLSTDISQHGVGRHTVTVTFEPADPDNFNSVYETAEIDIVKRDLSQYITFSDDYVKDENDKYVITYDYIASELSVTPCLNEEGTAIVNGIVANYGALKFVVTYNGQQSKPSAVNAEGYAVTVVIDDDNFGGNLTGATLIVEKALPTVELPAFRTVNLGEKIDNDTILSGSGYAYITNASGNVSVRGTFTIDPRYHGVATKANDNAISVIFTPDESGSYLTVTLPAILDVNGTSVDLEGNIVVTGEAVYGAKLSEFAISLKSGSDAAQIGTIAWVNPDAVADVGGEAEYVFTPNDEFINEYNIIRGTVVMNNVWKNTMKLGAGSRVYVYEGKPLSEAVIELNMVYGAEDMPVNGFTVSNITCVGGSLDESVGGSGAGTYLENVSLTFTVSHPNFEDYSASMQIYVYREITEFSVKNPSKYYDGEPVGLEELGISAGNTYYALDASDFYIEKLILNGEETDEIRAAGVYTVTVSIDEGVTQSGNAYYYGKHKGTYTFEYTVAKRDLSDYMSVTGNEKVYADNSVRLTVSFGEYDGKVDLSTVTYRYYAADGSRDYGVLPPTDAGNYKVTVTISDGNPSFTASREFDYTITKRTATITLESTYNYTYDPNLVVDVVPEVSNNLTSDSYKIYYRKQGATVETADKPVEAGVYVVRVEIVHSNYTGSATSTVNIAKADLEVTYVPTLDKINYGVKLGSSGISGGQVVSMLTGTAVSGKFVFVDPDNASLPVGSNTVSLRFVPDNSNYNDVYTSALIVVEKAHASLEDLSLTAVYNGKAQYPTFKTDLKLKYSFTQNGYNVDSAIAAGEYVVTVVVDDKNYEGSKQVTFTISKASPVLEESVMPVAGSVEYGRSLGNSYIGGGKMVYLKGGSAIAGSYYFLNEDTVLGDVGVYEGVQFAFVPADSANYEVYVGTLTVEVTKATATITVSNNSFTFGATADEIISALKFSTSPANMQVINDARFDEGVTVPRVGTYLFTASISDRNYQGTLQFAVYINKKGIDINFYRDTNVVDRYTFTYGNTSPAMPRIIIDTLVDVDELDYAEIQGMIICQYFSADDEEGAIPSVVQPSSVGDYYVTAILNHPDYYILEDSARISYSVTRAKVSSITFDPDLLSNQIYGSVSVPVVVTSPAGVGVRVEFPGYESMPLSAGNYSIKAVIDDPNYFSTELTAMFRINPKEISIENIKVQNKAYDGLPNVTVTGELSGVMVGDEVILSMTATTMGGKSEVGTYGVVITSWELGGLHAANYKVYEPVYSLFVKISSNVITDKATGSYITTPGGFSSNITVSFSEVYDTVNKSNFFTKLFGQKATVQVIEIKENGFDTVLGEKVKFYAKIPDEYLNSQNLVVEGLGNLSSVTDFTREGNYITFYADSSGEIVFYTNDFPYWVIIVIGAVVIIILGIIIILIAAPMRRRKHVNAGARKIHKWSENRGSLEESYMRELKAKREAKKRRWRI